MKHKTPSLKFIDGKDRKKLLRKLNEQFGIENLLGTIIKNKQDQFFIFQGNYTRKQIRELEQVANIDRIGIYFTSQLNKEFRLSIEGTRILKDQITKNIVELTDQEAETWIMGHEIEKTTNLKGFVIIKYKDEFLGTGKASENKITNYIPKSRRLKDRNVEK